MIKFPLSLYTWTVTQQNIYKNISQSYRFILKWSLHMKNNSGMWNFLRILQGRLRDAWPSFSDNYQNVKFVWEIHVQTTTFHGNLRGLMKVWKSNLPPCGCQALHSFLNKLPVVCLFVVFSFWKLCAYKTRQNKLICGVMFAWRRCHCVTLSKWPTFDVHSTFFWSTHEV